MKTCVPVTDTCTYKPYNASLAVFESAILSFLMRPSPLSGRIQDGDWVQIPVISLLRARMFRSLIIRTGIKERNIRARNIIPVFNGQSFRNTTPYCFRCKVVTRSNFAPIEIGFIFL